MPLGSRNVPYKLNTQDWVSPRLQDFAAGVDFYGSLFAGVLMNNGPAIRVHNDPPMQDFGLALEVNAPYDAQLAAQLRGAKLGQGQGRMM